MISISGGSESTEAERISLVMAKLLAGFPAPSKACRVARRSARSSEICAADALPALEFLTFAGHDLLDPGEQGSARNGVTQAVLDDAHLVHQQQGSPPLDLEQHLDRRAVELVGAGLLQDREDLFSARQPGTRSGHDFSVAGKGSDCTEIAHPGINQ